MHALKTAAVVESCYNLPIPHGFPWCQESPAEIACSCALTKRCKKYEKGAQQTCQHRSLLARND